MGDIPTTIQPLRQLHILSGLTEQELFRLLEFGVEKRYNKKEVIFHEGDPVDAVYLIKNGKIKMSKMTEDGQEQVLGYLSAGEIFPHVGFFEDVPLPATAEVAEDATLLVIRTKSFEELLLKNPEISVKIIRIQSRMLREMEARVRDLAFKDARQRTINVLSRLGKKHGVRTKQGVLIKIPLTHQELAGMVGTSRETVSRMLNELKREEIITVTKEGIVLLDEQLFFEG